MLEKTSNNSFSKSHVSFLSFFLRQRQVSRVSPFFMDIRGVHYETHMVQVATERTCAKACLHKVKWSGSDMPIHTLVAHRKYFKKKRKKERGNCHTHDN